MKQYVMRVMLLFALAAPLLAQHQRRAEATATQTASSQAGEARTQPSRQDPSYIIGPNDVLDIRVFKEPDLSLSSVKVRPDGKISVPLLNDIQAQGLTPVQLAASISELLRKYVQEPKVTVIVTQNTGERVYVVGEVGRPGFIALDHDMTVVQAIAMAGGFTEYANRKGSYVLRTENGKSTLIHFSYKKALRGDPSQNLKLKQGDTVVVP